MWNVIWWVFISRFMSSWSCCRPDIYLISCRTSQRPFPCLRASFPLTLKLSIYLTIWASRLRKNIPGPNAFGARFSLAERLSTAVASFWPRPQFCHDLVRFPVPTSAQWVTTLYGFIRCDCVCLHILHNMGCGVDIRAEHLSMTSFGSGWQAVRMQLFIDFLESNIS